MKDSPILVNTTPSNKSFYNSFLELDNLFSAIQPDYTQCYTSVGESEEQKLARILQTIENRENQINIYRAMECAGGFMENICFVNQYGKKK